MQAGMLEGQVSDVMVMDIWQASLMRAFAQQQLSKETDAAAADVEGADNVKDEQASFSVGLVRSWL